jgi:hypothetical protein
LSFRPTGGEETKEEFDGEACASDHGFAVEDLRVGVDVGCPVQVAIMNEVWGRVNG